MDMNAAINRMEQVKALKNGKGLKYLLDEAYKILGNPILMHDLECKSIAYTENIVTDDELWNDFVNNNGFSNEAVELLKDEGVFDIAANIKGGVILTGGNLKYDRIFAKIRDKDNLTVAGIDLLACYKPFEEDDPAVFDALCDLLSKEVSQIEFFRTYGSEYQEGFIKRLIDGNIEDKGFYPVHLENLYNGLKDNLYIAVADPPRHPEHDNPLYFKDLLKKSQPAYKYALYDKYIIIIISSDATKLNIDKDLHKLNHLFEHHNIYAGISRCFQNLFELQKYYAQAVNALKRGLERGGRRIFPSDKN